MNAIDGKSEAPRHNSLAAIPSRVRQRVLVFAADIIERAATFGRDRWGLTPYTTGIRVNVGWTEILTTGAQGLRVIAVHELVKRELLSPRVTLTTGEGEGPIYSTVPGSALFEVPYLPRQALSSIIEALWPGVAEAVRLAARRPAGRGVKAGHSRAAVTALQDLVGRALPPASHSRELARCSQLDDCATVEGSPNAWWCNMSHCSLFDERDLRFLRRRFALARTDLEMLSLVKPGDVVLMYREGRGILALCQVAPISPSASKDVGLESGDVFLNRFVFSPHVPVPRPLARELRALLEPDGPFDVGGYVKQRYLSTFSLRSLSALTRASRFELPNWLAPFLPDPEASAEDQGAWSQADDGARETEPDAVVTGSRASPLDGMRRSIKRMTDTARHIVAAANGQQVLRALKNKELRFQDSNAFARFLEELLERQNGRCAITGLPLQFDGEHADPELLCSLDRIDSDGHYEAGNLQIVCRFVNKWKNDGNDSEFRRLIELVRDTRTAG